jgi:hypothetical protein
MTRRRRFAPSIISSSLGPSIVGSIAPTMLTPSTRFDVSAGRFALFRVGSHSQIQHSADQEDSCSGSIPSAPPSHLLDGIVAYLAAALSAETNGSLAGAHRRPARVARVAVARLAGTRSPTESPSALEMTAHVADEIVVNQTLGEAPSAVDLLETVMPSDGQNRLQGSCG